MILEKKLFLAPMAKNPQRILDLGTGTGWISSLRTLSAAELIFQEFGLSIWQMHIQELRFVQKST